MPSLREVATQALEAMEKATRFMSDSDYRKLNQAIDALKAALADGDKLSPGEPVAWLTPRTVDSYMRPDLGYETCSKTDYAAFPVYTAPPQRKLRHVSYVCPQCHWSLDERKPLTKEEIRGLADQHLFYQPEGYEVSGIFNFARAIERAHGIGEHQ